MRHFGILLLFTKKGGLFQQLNFVQLLVPKLFPRRKTLSKFCHGAFITINFKNNEVDKSCIIHINKKLKERNTQNT